MPIITLTISGILAIIFGIIVIALPRSLNIVVGIYLILIGLLQIINGLQII